MNKYYPNWQDSNKIVACTTESGEKVVGVLYADDFKFNGEDEIPPFKVETDDGRNIPFYEFEEWEFVE